MFVYVVIKSTLTFLIVDKIYSQKSSHIEVSISGIFNYLPLTIKDDLYKLYRSYSYTIIIHVHIMVATYDTIKKQRDILNRNSKTLQNQVITANKLYQIHFTKSKIDTKFSER